jgi:probable RNA-binding protein EIF1AD
MSRRKHLLQSSLLQDVEPPGDGQQIVRAVGSRGGNIIEVRSMVPSRTYVQAASDAEHAAGPQVETADGVSTLCLMPAKFHKKLWVKRGGYLIIEHSQDAASDSSSKVTGTIVAVLYEEHIKQLKKHPGVW